MRPRRFRLSAYGIIQHRSRILLCRLSAALPRWCGCWTFPGGGVEFGESPEAAMIREVHEETGLHVSSYTLAATDTVHDLSPDEEFHGLRVLYHAEVREGLLSSERCGSTDLCAWHPVSEIHTLPLVDLVSRNLDLLQKPAC